MTFQNMDASATQLTVLHSGTGGPFTFDGVAFTTLTGGDAGLYVRANENSGGDDLVINLTNSTPADGSAFELEESGAVIN